MTGTIRRCLARLPRAEIDDVVQDTLLLLLRVGPRIAGFTRVQLDAYAATVARRRAAKWRTIRARSPAVGLGLLEHVRADRDTGSLQRLREALRARWSSLPPGLTPDQRNLLGCGLFGSPGIVMLLQRYDGAMWKVLRAARALGESLGESDRNQVP